MRSTWTGSFLPWRYLSARDCVAWAPDPNDSDATSAFFGRSASAAGRAPWPWTDAMAAGGASEVSGASDANLASQRSATEGLL